MWSKVILHAKSLFPVWRIMREGLEKESYYRIIMLVGKLQYRDPWLAWEKWGQVHPGQGKVEVTSPAAAKAVVWKVHLGICMSYSAECSMRKSLYSLTVLMLGQVDCSSIADMVNLKAGLTTRRTDSCSVLWTVNAWELRVQLLALLKVTVCIWAIIKFICFLGSYL